MKTKNIYLGKVSQDMLEACGDCAWFNFAGEKWEFRLDVDIEGGFLRLQDSVGRMVPIDSAHYIDFISALAMVSDVQGSYDELVSELDDLDSSLCNLGLTQDNVVVDYMEIFNGE